MHAWTPPGNAQAGAAPAAAPTHPLVPLHRCHFRLCFPQLFCGCGFCMPTSQRTARRLRSETAVDPTSRRCHSSHSRRPAVGRLSSHQRHWHHSPRYGSPRRHSSCRSSCGGIDGFCGDGGGNRLLSGGGGVVQPAPQRRRAHQSPPQRERQRRRRRHQPAPELEPEPLPP